MANESMGGGPSESSSGMRKIMKNVLKAVQNTKNGGIHDSYLIPYEGNLGLIFWIKLTKLEISQAQRKMLREILSEHIPKCFGVRFLSLTFTST